MATWSCGIPFLLKIKFEFRFFFCSVVSRGIELLCKKHRLQLCERTAPLISFVRFRYINLCSADSSVMICFISFLSASINLPSDQLFAYCRLTRFRTKNMKYFMLIRIPLDGISLNLMSWIFFENLSTKFKFNYNLTRIMVALHEDLCTFMVISRSALPKMRNVSDKVCLDIQ